MKTLLTVILLIFSLTANALRCGNQLIEIGDPLFKVRDNCQVLGEYRDSNNNADILILYVREGVSGMVSVKLVDGIVKQIGEE